MPYQPDENYALNAKKGAEKFQKDRNGSLVIEFSAEKSVLVFGRFEPR